MNDDAIEGQKRAQSVEERVVAMLAKQGEIVAADSERVKSIARQLRKKLDADADESKQWLKQHGFV